MLPAFESFQRLKLLFANTQHIGFMASPSKKASTTNLHKLSATATSTLTPKANEPVFDKRSLCVDILVEGHVNSFVDFFYLTHRPEDDTSHEIHLDQLPYVKEFLCTAEAAHRKGDSPREYEAYKKLADYFQEITAYKTAVFFYEKCLEISETMDDTRRQCIANSNLGIVHDKLNETIKSIGFHERHLAIGERTNDDAAKLTANRHLVEVYRTLADQHDKKGEIDAALACLRKSLHAASQIDEPKAEGASYHKLSLALLKRGDVDAAIENAKSFLAICKQNGDQLGEGAACSALAQCYQAVKKTELAVQYLESFLDIATRHQQVQQQAEACCQLGNIHAANGEHDKAVEYFEKNYELARATGQRNLIDAARITLGTAKGRLDIGKFMNVVKEDLPTLLKWKSKRIAFGGK